MRNLQYKHFFSVFNAIMYSGKGKTKHFCIYCSSYWAPWIFWWSVPTFGGIIPTGLSWSTSPYYSPSVLYQRFFSPSIINSAGTLRSGVQFYCLYTDFVWKSTMPGITPCWRFPLFLTLILSLHKSCFLYYCGTHKIDLCCHLPYATCWVVT